MTKLEKNLLILSRIYLILGFLPLFIVTPLPWLPEGGPSGLERDTRPYASGLLLISPVLFLYSLTIKIFFWLCSEKPIRKRLQAVPPISLLLLWVTTQTSILVRDALSGYGSNHNTGLELYLILSVCLSFLPAFIVIAHLKFRIENNNESLNIKKLDIAFLVAFILFSILHLLLGLQIIVFINNSCCTPHHSLISFDIFGTLFFAIIGFFVSLFVKPYLSMDFFNFILIVLAVKTVSEMLLLHLIVKSIHITKKVGS